MIYYYPGLHPKDITKDDCYELQSKYDWPSSYSDVLSWIRQEVAEDFYDSCGGDWTTGEMEFTVYDTVMNKIMEFTAEIDYQPRFYTKML